MKAGLRKGCRACVCGLLAAVLLAAAVGPAYATKKDVEDAKKRASSLETEKKKVEATLKNLEGLKQDAVAYVRELDSSLSALNEELEELGEQITQKEEDIRIAGLELEAAREVEARQYESMKLRIKYMYERGEVSYLDMLLQSKNMMQFMNRAEYIRKISEYDRKNG